MRSLAQFAVGDTRNDLGRLLVVIPLRYALCGPDTVRCAASLSFCPFIRPSRSLLATQYFGLEVKASSLEVDIAPLTIPDSGALQPRKWQLTGIDCSTAAQAVAAQSPR